MNYIVFSGDVFVDLALFSSESQTFFVSKKLGFYSCSAVKGWVLIKYWSSFSNSLTLCSVGSLVSTDLYFISQQYFWQFSWDFQMDHTPKIKSNSTLFTLVKMKKNYSSYYNLYIFFYLIILVFLYWFSLMFIQILHFLEVLIWRRWRIQNGHHFAIMTTYT